MPSPKDRLKFNPKEDMTAYELYTLILIFSAENRVPSPGYILVYPKGYADMSKPIWRHFDLLEELEIRPNSET